jgi:DNA-binding SARP family transcriptional activator
METELGPRAARRERSVRPATLTAAVLPIGRHVARPRLLGRLAARFEHRATILLAGPGFGKTSLLVQAHDDNAVSPRGIDVWLSCLPSHEAAAVLGTALRRMVFAPEAFDASVAETVAAVADVVWEQAPVQVCLMLDDVHHVPAGSSGAALLAALLEALPANGHLVLASRTAPPLPVARLAALGQVVWLEEDDLRFSSTELAEFAASRSVPVDALEATCGWPALAELAVLAGGAGRARRSLVEDYLWQEVLSALPPARRRDLGLLTGLGELDPELAAAAVGRPVDLEELMAGLPLVSRAGDRRRLHALLERALARDVDARARTAARARAAEVLAGRGDLVEAMRLVAGDAHWPGMRAVIRDAAGRGRVPIPAEVLASWLDAVPAAGRDDPEAHLLGAMVTAERTPRAAGPSFEAAIDAYRRRSDAEGELMTLVQWYSLAWSEGSQVTMARIVGGVLELANQGLDQAEVPAAQGRAVGEYMMGDWHAVLRTLDAVSGRPMSRELLATNCYLRALTHIGLGDPAGAMLAAQQAMGLGAHRHRIMALEALLLARSVAGDLEAARAGLQQHGLESYRIGWPNSVVAHHAAAAITEARTGHLDAASEHLARASGYQPAQISMLTRMWLVFGRAHCAIESGDEALAEALLRTDVAERPVGAPFTHLVHVLALVPLYVLVPESRPALDALDLAPLWSDGRSMARALVALRERGEVREAARLQPLRPERMRLHLPTAWAATLAVAASRGAAEAERLVDEIGPACARRVPALAASPPPVLAPRVRRLAARIPPRPPHDLEIRLLGPTELRRDGVPVDDADWSRTKVRALLAHLVAHRDARREELIADLWPELDETAGRGNLRFTLTCLQRVLEPDRGPGQPAFFVRADGDRLRLVPSDHLVVDAWRFERDLDEAEGARSPGPALEAYTRALPLWRGRYLSDLPYADWAAAPRERLDARFVAAAVRAGELFLARDGGARALELAALALDVDPYRETAFRLQAAAHLAMGDRAAMRLALARCREALSQLGAAPEPETEMLERSG